MTERAGREASLVDVLDRVLDKGIVLDIWVRITLRGIDLISAGTGVIVVSIHTYLKYADLPEDIRAGSSNRPSYGPKDEVP